MGCDYLRWVQQQLPHVIGADPDDGVGADCLIVAAKVRAAAGLPTPPMDPKWFTMAANGEWLELVREWRRVMEPCELEPYALILKGGGNGLGVSLVVDGGVLMVNHHRGVQWVPMDVASRMMRMRFWRPKDAAI
jgi:hypothetical protein